MVPIEPNILSDFASHTYSIRLYQTPYKEFSKVVRSVGARGHMSSLARHFSRIAIISETAVTPVQINNLNLSTYKSTQGITATNTTFDMTEPRGSTLIEQMMLARTDMGWPNTSDGRGLVLEIRFIGRRDDNTVVDNIATVSYPIMVSKMDINLDQSSTTYHVTAKVEGQGSATDTFIQQALQTTITVDTGNNVGDFFSNYAAMLNEKEESLVDNRARSIPRYIHEFDIDPYYASKEISNPKSGTQTSENQTFAEYNSDTNRVTFPKDTLIASSIDSIIYTIEEARDDLLESEDSVVYIHEIFPDVAITKFDEVAETFQHHIIWRVRRVPTLPELSERDDATTIRKKAEILTNSLKLYDFYYTGTNSEVKSINWVTNNLYTAKTTAYHNVLTRNNNNRSTTGKHSQETVDMDVMQSRAESALSDTWGIKPMPNDRGEMAYYTSDQDTSKIDYIQPHPRDVVNTADSDHSATDIDSNKKLVEYLNQLSYIRNMGGELPQAYVRMEMKIQGDPYWLLPPNPIMRGGTIQNASNASMPMFVLRFNHPSNDYYEGDEFITAKERSAFTGVYYVTGSITSNFNNGRFEQTITGRRAPVRPSDVGQLLIEGGIFY